MGDADPRPRIFYMLPKIHKDPSTWSRPYEIPLGRPIVSDCSSETCYTAEFIDFYLNPLSTRHDSYIKDTYDFVNKIKRVHIPVDSFLFTIDIDSLYTNIDTTEGLQTISNIFSKYPDATRPDAQILQLLNINLTRNDLVFNGEFFLQVKGTAMGKKFAPAYANIFMAEWEVAALASCPKKPLHYFRFLDDIWGVWPHSRDDFDVFLAVLNTHNPSITIKSTFSPSSLIFWTQPHIRAQSSRPHPGWTLRSSLKTSRRLGKTRTSRISSFRPNSVRSLALDRIDRANFIGTNPGYAIVLHTTCSLHRGREVPSPRTAFI